MHKVLWLCEIYCAFHSLIICLRRDDRCHTASAEDESASRHHLDGISRFSLDLLRCAQCYRAPSESATYRTLDTHTALH